MNNDDSESRLERQHSSRRKFIGGAGLLSAVLTAARRTAAKSAPLLLPTATKDITPFKVDVPQAALDDLKERLAKTRALDLLSGPRALE
jgi:hypothetical protein